MSTMHLNPLTKYNYMDWSLQMTAILRQKGLWEVTSGIDTELVKLDVQRQHITARAQYLERYEAAAKEYRKECSKAVGTIFGGMEPSIHEHYKAYTDPKKLWDKLAENHNDSLLSPSCLIVASKTTTRSTIGWLRGTG